MNQELKQQEQENSTNRLYILAIGVAFIVAAIGQIANVNNSWALFMLIPIGFFAAQLWMSYQQAGKLSDLNMGVIIAAIATLGTMSVFLVESLSWGIMAPVGLLAVGIAFVVTRL